MNKYGGLLIHQSYDEQGLIEVIDTKGIRSLHFGNDAQQSSVQLSHPYQLYLRYTQTLMSWLLFKPIINDVLMIGLGGGTLANYFLYHFDDCNVKVVEYRPNVLKIARSHFGLPLKESRLKTLIADGSDYLRKQSTHDEGRYPLMIIDAFDSQGMSDAVTHSAFFDHCKSALNQEGLLVINLWKTDKALYEKISWDLQQVFHERVLFLPVEGRDNVIAFAFNDGFQPLNFKSLIKQTYQLQQSHFLDFPLYLKKLKTNNPTTFKKIVLS
ncbi:MAG: spermine synthase [Methylococcales bacterium]|nr:spermine synthase [Methylococcales bacterium]